jgi:hypothetical protein
MPSSGVSLTQIVPGTVPEYEEREAARFGGYTWRDWERMPTLSRVRTIAHRRVMILIDMHHADRARRD